MSDDKKKYIPGDQIEFGITPDEGRPKEVGGYFAGDVVELEPEITNPILKKQADSIIGNESITLEQKSAMLSNLMEYSFFLSEIVPDNTELDDDILESYKKTDYRHIALDIYDYLEDNELPEEYENLVKDYLAENYSPSIEDITGLTFDESGADFIELKTNIESEEREKTSIAKKILYSAVLSALVVKGAVDISNIFASKDKIANSKPDLPSPEITFSGKEKALKGQEIYMDTAQNQMLRDSITQGDIDSGIVEIAGGRSEVKPSDVAEPSSGKGTIDQVSAATSDYKAYDSRDLDGDLSKLYKAYPELKKFLVGNKINVSDVTVMMHPAKQNSKNHYTEKSVKEAISIMDTKLKDANGWEDYADIVYEIHKTLEGKSNKAYGDIFGYKTIGVGNLLYNPDTKDKDKLRHIKEVRKVLGDITEKEYRRVYNGEVSLSNDQVKKLHTNYITRKNGGKDRIESIIDKALEGTDLKRADIDPRLIITMLSADYQSQIAMKKSPEQIAQNVKVASTPSKSEDGWKIRQQAALNIIDIYKNKTHLKEDVEKDMSHRLRLANRSKFWKSVHIGDVTRPMDIKDAIGEVKIVMRDDSRNGETNVIIFGNLQKGQSLEDIITSKKLNLNEKNKLNIYHFDGKKSVKFEQKKTGFSKKSVEFRREKDTDGKVKEKRVESEEFIKNEDLGKSLKKGGRIRG